MDNDVLTVTLSSEDEEATAIIDANRMKMARITVDEILSGISKKIGESEHPEMYFYTILALYEQARDTISYIGPKNFKYGLEV